MAYASLHNIDRPTPGETVVVAAASEAVGAVVSQIARIQGVRVVVIAGRPDFPRQLAAACPDGIDIYFENVGSAVREAVLFSKLVVQGVGRAVERRRVPAR